MKKNRFFLRSFFTLRSCTKWFDHLDADPYLRRCVRFEPQLAEKLHRPYRRVGLSTQQRLNLLLEHFNISTQIGLTKIVAITYRESLEIAHFEDREKNTFVLSLTRPGQFGKEGDVAMHLSDGQNRLYSMCFSLRETAGIRELDIGCVQGPDDEKSREMIRQLTRGMHGLRPRSLMLEAARDFAQATHCARLRLVGNHKHIYRSWRKRKDISFNYDEFCADIDASVQDGGDWIIPLVGELRPISEVASKKRAETLRRRNLLETIHQEIMAQFSHITSN